MAFLGISEFKHFVGVVEDRFDPQKLGRLRVRCLGIHSADKNKIASSDLPWASVLLPTTSAGISGLGQSPSFIVEGAWVWGYFRDGNGLMQEMVIVGTLPGKPAELGNTESGFYDPNFRLDKDGNPTTISVYPKEMAEPDTNRLAVNDTTKEHGSLTSRKAARLENIPTADFDEVGSNIAASDTDNWSQPAITYNAVYPYNHVFESESGHIKEYDDSFTVDEDGIRTNHYRIYERHSSGTSYEIDTAGNRIDLNMASYFNITNKDKFYFVHSYMVKNNKFALSCSNYEQQKFVSLVNLFQCWLHFLGAFVPISAALLEFGKNERDKKVLIPQATRVIFIVSFVPIFFINNLGFSEIAGYNFSNVYDYKYFYRNFISFSNLVFCSQTY